MMTGHTLLRACVLLGLLLTNSVGQADPLATAPSKELVCSQLSAATGSAALSVMLGQTAVIEQEMQKAKAWLGPEGFFQSRAFEIAAAQVFTHWYSVAAVLNDRLLNDGHYYRADGYEYFEQDPNKRRFDALIPPLRSWKFIAAFKFDQGESLYSRPFAKMLSTQSKFSYSEKFFDVFLKNHEANQVKIFQILREIFFLEPDELKGSITASAEVLRDRIARSGLDDDEFLEQAKLVTSFLRNAGAAEFSEQIFKSVSKEFQEFLIRRAVLRSSAPKVFEPARESWATRLSSSLNWSAQAKREEKEAIDLAFSNTIQAYLRKIQSVRVGQLMCASQIPQQGTTGYCAYAPVMGKVSALPVPTLQHSSADLRIWGDELQMTYIQVIADFGTRVQNQFLHDQWKTIEAIQKKATPLSSIDQAKLSAGLSSRQDGLRELSRDLEHISEDFVQLKDQLRALKNQLLNFRPLLQSHLLTLEGLTKTRFEDKLLSVDRRIEEVTEAVYGAEKFEITMSATITTIAQTLEQIRMLSAVGRDVNAFSLRLLSLTTPALPAPSSDVP